MRHHDLIMSPSPNRALGDEDGGIKMNDHCEGDLVRWAEAQSSLLRRRASGELVHEAEIDWANVAEEIDSVGRSERRALASHVRTIIEHLMRLDASPTTDPRPGWRHTIERERQQLADVLDDSPSLRRELDKVVAAQTQRARRIMAVVLTEYGETPRKPLNELCYSTDQVLGPPLRDPA
jgi:hypothetical protein